MYLEQRLFRLLLPLTSRARQVEGPTGYMLSAFTAFYTVDVKTGALTSVDNVHPAELSAPLVFSTPDGSAAMGAMASPATASSFSVTYAKYNFASLEPFDNGTTKWSNVFRSGPHAKVRLMQLERCHSHVRSCLRRAQCCRMKASCVSGSCSASLIAWQKFTKLLQRTQAPFDG